MHNLSLSASMTMLCGLVIIEGRWFGNATEDVKYTQSEIVVSKRQCDLNTVVISFSGLYQQRCPLYKLQIVLEYVFFI